MARRRPADAPVPDVRMPGIATAAAVLGFVEAGLALAFVVLGLAQTAESGTGGEPALTGLVLFCPIALSALHLLGALFLVRGRGRRLLLGATVAEMVVAVAIGTWVFVEVSDTYDPYGFTDGLGAAVGAGVVIGLVLPAVRLVLTAQPAVGRWLTGLSHTRQAVPPVWSPEANTWVPGPRVRSAPGAVLALLTPVAALAIATLVVLVISDPPREYVTPAPGLDDVGPGSTSDWSYLYDGGDPVEPPTSSDPEYDPFYDDDARDCFDGDLDACDSLYHQTPVGSLYEWLGSTCGGRQEEETSGNCA